MTSAVQQIQKKKPSKKLLEAISSLGKEAAGYFKKLEDRVNEVLELGRKEGFDDIEIGNWIRAETKEHYSKMTISRLLPPTAKHMEKARSFGNKMLPNPVQDKTVQGIDNDSNIDLPTPLTNHTVHGADEIIVPPSAATNQPTAAATTTTIITKEPIQQQQPSCDDVLTSEQQEIIDDARQKLELIDEIHELEIKNIELKRQVEVAKPFLDYIEFLTAEKGETYADEYIHNYKKDIEAFKRIVKKEHHRNGKT